MPRTVYALGLLWALPLTPLPPVTGRPAPQSAAAAEPYRIEIGRIGVGGLTSERADALRVALESLAGVAAVRVDTEKAHVEVGTWDGAFLPRAEVRGALAKLDLELGAIVEPRWARLEVLAVEASGGG